MAFSPSYTGFFGKLPARGDFIRSGLPESCVERLDVWNREVLHFTRTALNGAWEEAWMTAPIWHFRLPPGPCGPLAVFGIWFASIDKAGRHYPFILAALAADYAALAQGGAWAESAEQAGLAAITEDAPHDQLLQRLNTGEAPLLYPPGWQTSGNSVVRACQLPLNELFPVDRSTELLRDPIGPEVLPQ